MAIMVPIFGTRIETREIIPSGKEATVLIEIALISVIIFVILTNLGFKEMIESFFRNLVPGQLFGVDNFRILSIFTLSFLIAHMRNILKD